MAEEEQHQDTLARIPADRALVEALYAGGRIGKEARHYALALLYPHDKWGLWTARLLLALGTALMLAGVIYFFAFNWAKIPPAAKLAGIQAALIGCLVMVCRASLKNLHGQLWLLAASVLTGVFLAVFGQIYQTGADAWQLFALWAVLVSGWTGIAAFAAQWLLWLLLVNTALWLWWDQAALPGEDMAFMILLWLTLLNGAALALREYFAVLRGCTWLAARWTRLLLTVTVLLFMLISPVVWIFEAENASLSIKLSGATGVLGHIALYYLYRHRLADLRSLTATVLSACVVLDCVVIKKLIIDPGRVLSHAILLYEESLLLLAGLLTIGLFTAAALYLKRAARQMEVGRPEYATRHNAASLLTELGRKDLARAEELADFIIHRQRGKPPLFFLCLNILLAIGALIAGPIFFLALYQETSTPVLVALLLVAGAVWLQQQAGEDYGIKHSVLTQSSLAVMVAGKLWFLYAFGETLNNYLTEYGYDRLWSNTLALLIITALVYPFYRVAAGRFLFPFIVLCCALSSIMSDTGEHSALLFHPFFLCQFVAAAVLLTRANIKADYMPLAYALVCSLCVHVLFLAWVALTWDDTEVISPYFASLVLSGGLIALLGWAAGDMAKLKTQPLLLASTGAVLLGLMAPPGMLLAIMLMVFGYARHERALLAMGAALIPVFLFFYYYQLDLSLLQKSAALAGSGALLLTARFYLRRRGWDKSSQPCA